MGACGTPGLMAVGKSGPEVVTSEDPRTVELSREEARHLLAAILLDLPAGSEAPRKEEPAFHVERALDAVRVVQMDPVRRVAESHHLSLALRMPGYRPSCLEDAERKARIVEVRAHERSLVPVSDLPLYMPRMRRAAERLRSSETGVSEAVRTVLDRLEREGPLQSRAFVTGAGKRVEGFWDRAGDPRTQATSLALEILWDEGRVTVFREAGTRVYDLPERHWPRDIRKAAQDMDDEEARRGRLLAYLSASGLGDVRDVHVLLDRSPASVRRDTVRWAVESGRALPVTVRGDAEHPRLEGLLLRPESLDAWESHAAPATRARSLEPCLLPPLDNVLWQRGLVARLMDLDYRWEVYVPQARRRVGPYGMPLWNGETLVGQVDAVFDRSERRLTGRVHPGASQGDASVSGARRGGRKDAHILRWAERALRDLARTLGRMEGTRPPEVFALWAGSSDGPKALGRSEGP